MSIGDPPPLTKKCSFFRITGNEAAWPVGSVSDLISKRAPSKVLHQTLIEVLPPILPRSLDRQIMIWLPVQGK